MRTLLLLILLAAPALASDEADRAWSGVAALEKGPGRPPDDAPEAVVKIARAHLAKQEQALSDFITRFPDDPRRFEAEIKFAGVSAALGASLSDRSRVEKALQRLAAVERSDSAPAKAKADAAFLRITTTMQTVNLAAAARPGEAAGARNTILESAQNFAGRYPEDRRAARLLTEAATLLDDQPNRKRKVLEQAQSLARDEGTRQRIADDLQRLDMLGSSPDISFPTIQGRDFSIAAERGRVVVLIFWAGWSPPSVVWLSEFSKTAREWPPDRVTIATVSLDRRRDEGAKTLRALGLMEWPTSCEGGGWDNALARRLAINALPTVFVFDREGRLRELNAKANCASVVRQLLAEKPGVRR